MRAEGLPDLAIRAFSRHYSLLRAGETGLIPESGLAPAPTLPDADALGEALEATGSAALSACVVIKLNGGLGTSMGLAKAKSLLPVRGGLTFLDLIARQSSRAGCSLLLMNSFATRRGSLEALSAYPELSGGLRQDFVQHKVPKVDVDTLNPAQHVRPELAWCPPGHGDLYTALVTSGALEQLLNAGRRYAFVSNADNLGAVLDPRILGFFVRESLPFLMEVADRTEADRKGGHLALRDGQLILREAAQCPEEDARDFQDIQRHRYFNTNNIWIDLEALAKQLSSLGGFLPLPLIRNRKNIDPRDPSSAPIYQLESAMGAAISLFEGARALRVPRTRFAPVKTCADLLRVRSDVTSQTPDFRLIPNPNAVVSPLVIDLDPHAYRFVHQLDEHFPAGPPSLISCRSLKIRGAVRFGRGVQCRGDVVIENRRGDRADIPDGAMLEGDVVFDA